MFKRTRKKTDPLVFKNIAKKISIGDKTCTFVIEDVAFKEIDGKETMLDEVLVSNMISEMATAMKRNYSKYNAIPETITLSKTQKNNTPAPSKEDFDEIIEPLVPRYTIEDVYLPEHTKIQLQSVLSLTKYRKRLMEDWGLKNTVKKGNGLVLNFFGPPGTGKSMLAEAVANELGKKVYIVNYAELESKYVGETPKNISKAFQKAKDDDAVLIFDEADSFLGKRLTNVNQSADYGVNITRSVMLIEIEKFDGIVIFTTNLVSNYDDAFRRRILASLEFTYPDERGREMIWNTHIPKQLPLEQDITAPLLAKKYEQITGADIKDILLNAAVLALQNQSEQIKWEHFNQAYQFIKQRYSTGKKVHIKKETITDEQYEREMAELRGGS